MSASEKTALQEKLYGRTSLLTRKTGLQNTPQLVESPLLLSAREQAEKRVTNTTQPATPESDPPRRDVAGNSGRPEEADRVQDA